jgi:hypothetical protein
MTRFIGLFDTTRWLHFTVHHYAHTSVQSHIFTSRRSVAASNGGRSPSSGFPNYPEPQLQVSHNDWISVAL